MKTFLRTLGAAFIRSFSGRNALFHIAAIALTAAIVLSGLDWAYYAWVHALDLFGWSVPALMLGTSLPVLLPIILIIWGSVARIPKASIAGWAVGQAALLGSVISSIYKALTGRVEPPHTLAADTSREFLFGFWNHGIFWGWPSSHTTIAFAMALALIMLVPSKAVRAIASVYALWVGVSVTIGIHWLSEFVAGALIGAAIGMAVGRIWKNAKI